MTPDSPCPCCGHNDMHTAVVTDKRPTGAGNSPMMIRGGITMCRTARCPCFSVWRAFPHVRHVRIPDFFQIALIRSKYQGLSVGGDGSYAKMLTDFPPQQLPSRPHGADGWSVHLGQPEEPAREYPTE